MHELPLSERRPLGRSELQVSPLCLGGNVFGWTADERRSFEVLDAFVEAGGNFVNTAVTRLRLDAADLSELQAP